MAQLVRTLQQLWQRPLRLAWRIVALEGFAWLIRLFLLPSPKGRHRFFHVPSPNSSRPSIPCLAYYPPSSSSTPLPVYVNFHGGGFVSGCLSDNSEWCERVASECGAVVLSVDYRLGLWERFPCANDDCETVVAAVVNRSPPFDDRTAWPIDVRRIALGGDSAGGSLAIATAAHPALRPSVCCVVAFYPALNMTVDARHKPRPPSYPRFDPVGAMLGVLLHDLVADYAHNFSGAAASDPRLSPLLLPTSELPRSLLLLTADMDILLEEQERFVRRVHESEVGRQRLLQRRFPHSLHGFLTLPDFLLSRVMGVEALVEKHQAMAAALHHIRTALAVED